MTEKEIGSVGVLFNSKNERLLNLDAAILALTRLWNEDTRVLVAGNRRKVPTH